MKKIILICSIIFLSISLTKATNVSGGIYSNTTWTLAGSPYIITDTIVVFPGATLTIQPGVIVKFYDNQLLDVRGNLYANGTPSDSIIFTSNSGSPQAGIYKGIEGATSLSYCGFYYANTALFGIGGGIPIAHCSFTSCLLAIGYLTVHMDSCNFRYDSIGVNMTDGNARMTSCQFISNGVGIVNLQSSVYNAVFSKNDYGIQNSGPGDTVANCIVDSNKAFGVAISDGKVVHCIITHNGVGVANENGMIELNDISDNTIGVELIADDTLLCNWICGNLKYSVVSEETSNISAQDNYWCLPDSISIGSTIYDGRTNITLGLVFFTPFDTVPCSYFCTNSYDQAICIVTTDTAIDKNVIIWGRTNSPPHGSFNIYDSTGSGWVKIGSVPDTALSEFIDTASHPDLQSYSYRISTVDSCGESVLSPTNTSIYLQVAQLTGRDSLYWTPYVGFTTPHYLIYRGLSLNALTLIDSVTGTSTNYVDIAPPLGSIYLVEAENPSGGCVPTHRRIIRSHQITISSYASESNGGIPRIPTGVSGIQDPKNSVLISPNPNNGRFNVSCHSASNTKLLMEVYNVLGEKVYSGSLGNSQGNNQLNLQQAGGIYLYKIITENGVLFAEGKIVLEK